MPAHNFLQNNIPKLTLPLNEESPITAIDEPNTKVSNNSSKYVLYQVDFRSKIETIFSTNPTFENPLKNSTSYLKPASTK